MRISRVSVIGLATLLQTAAAARSSSRREAGSERQWPHSRSNAATAACKQVGDAQARGARYVAPSLALECLNSVPLDVERSLALLDYAAPFISFHSNHAFLKDPPADYRSHSGTSGVDLLAGLADVRQKVKSRGYKSQYEFTAELEQLGRKAGDVHLLLAPALNRVFVFARDVAMVSVSADSVSKPQVFDAPDLLASLAGAYKASPVAKIDGFPVFDFLDNVSRSAGRTHDLDAGFNNLLPSIAKRAAGVNIAPVIQGGYYLSLPDNTTTELANGTTFSFPNAALLRLDFRGIRSGEDLARAASIPRAPRRLAHRQSAADPGPCRIQHTSPRPSNIPRPIDEHKDHWAGAFALGGSAYSDITVLELNSFMSLYSDVTSDLACGVGDQREFHRFFESFATTFKSSGKKRLVLDLSANSGGFEAVLADLIAQLFPREGATPPFRYRVRATPVLSWILENSPGALGQPVGSTGHVERIVDDARALGKGNWGPELLAGDNFTALLRRDMKDQKQSVGIDHTALTEALVKPEDMIILTDGDCHSSCALLVDWLTQLGVRTVAMGGRPTSGPMAAVGGTKGAGLLSWYSAQSAVYRTLRNTNGSAPRGLQLPSLDDAPLLMAGDGVGAMDVWHDKATVPAQFEVAPADCRLFYTLDTFLNIEAMWKAAADAAWRGAPCAPGSKMNGAKSAAAGARLAAVKEDELVVAVATAEQARDSAALRRASDGGWAGLTVEEDLRWQW